MYFISGKMVVFSGKVFIFSDRFNMILKKTNDLEYFLFKYIIFYAMSFNVKHYCTRIKKYKCDLLLGYNSIINNLENSF